VSVSLIASMPEYSMIVEVELASKNVSWILLKVPDGKDL
jgi:hypothetical protein